MTETNSDGINSTHYLILCVLIFIFQFFSKLKENLTKLEDFPEADRSKGHRLMLKYITVYEFAKAADWCLGPFVFEFFHNYHSLNNSQIAQLQALSFTSNLFLGPFLVGFLNDKTNKKIPCLLFSCVLSASCLVRMNVHPISLFLSQFFFGCASSILYSSFENWLNVEAKLTFPDAKTRGLVLSSIFEKSMISDSIVAVTVSLVAGKLNKAYGIQAPYFFSVFLSSCCFLLVILLVPSMPPEETSTNAVEKAPSLFTNLKEGIKCCINSPFLALIGLTESLLLACLHIFIFIWTPTLKALNKSCDTGQVFTLFMIALIVGGIAFKAIFMQIKSSMKIAKYVSGCTVIAFSIANYSNDFQLTFYSFLLFEISVGLIYPTYSMIKSEYLPHNLRGTIMNLFKIPLHLIVIILLLGMDKLFTIEKLILINLVFSGFVFIIHVTCFYDKTKPEKEEKENEVKLKKEN